MTTYPPSVSSSPALTDETTLQVALKCLLEFIPLETQGTYPLATLYHVLLWAASRHDTVEHACQVLEGVPSGNGVRHHLNKLDQMIPLEHHLNTALHHRLPEDIVNHRHRLAIDLHLIPYYGTPTEHERPYLYRSQAKAGTTTFFAYATVYVIQCQTLVVIGSNLISTLPFSPLFPGLR
jgi:hypothetical protein